MSTKTTTYAPSSKADNNPFRILRSDDKRTDNSRPFTKEENEIFKALSKNTHDSIWGEAIKLCVKAVREKSDYKKFRDLIESLISQGKDNPVILKNIIGVEGFEVLMKVSRAEMRHG